MASEEEGAYTRPPESVSVVISSCKNLKGTKGDTVTSLVRVEFGNNLLGESPKAEAKTETKTTDYNFKTSFECGFSDPLYLDDIAHKPIVVTVVEVLPKDKKGKEEKTNILGQCTFDLIPLLHGETKFQASSHVYPPVPPVEPQTDVELPELEVAVSVNQPLLTPQQLNEINLLSVRVESAYSVPDAWLPGGPPFIYSVTLPVPITPEKENAIVVPNGILRTPLEKELCDKRKWNLAPTFTGQATYMADSALHEVPIEDEDGDLKEKENREFRAEAIAEKNRVTWNTERRCFITAESAESLQAKIAQNRVWPVEIMRTPIPQATKGKRGAAAADDENTIFHHGVAYVNFAPLLYPGVRKIRGAYLIKPFLESEVLEKTKRKGTLAEEAARIASGMSRNMSSALGTKAQAQATKGGKGDAKVKGSTAVLKPVDPLSETEVPEVRNVEGEQYLEARTFIILEFELSKPLVPKRPPSSLARKVAEYIPPRPIFPRKTGGAQKAVEDYHTQITSVANLLLEEFRRMFGDDILKGDYSQTGESMEMRKRKFLYELNTSGKYFAFKEQLKNAVVKIVREKYMRTNPFADKHELNAFLSDLYVFLIDQMHIGLNKFLSVEDEPDVPPPVADSKTLKHFAREAEVNQKFDLAIKYYQERLARNKNDPEHWLDYGTFCLLIGDMCKAEECFKETVAIDQRNMKGLLLYGCVALLQERHEVAETFFENATCIDPKSVVAWTMLGLYYDSLQNDIRAEMAFIEANRLNSEPSEHHVKVESHGEEEAEALEEEEEQQPEAQDEVTSGEDGAEPSPSQTSVPQEPPALVVSSDSVGEKSPVNPAAESSASPSGGNAPSNEPSNNQAEEGESQLEETSEVEEAEEKPEQKAPVSIFLQTAEFLLDENALQMAEIALAHELVAPGCGPSAHYFILLGRLRIQSKQYVEAEESLKEALALQHQNPDGWSLMGHLNFLCEKIPEARECYERTLSYTAEAADMHAIYLRLASIYLENSEFGKAKDCFLRTCRRSPSCVSWLGVGIACYRLGELSEAEDALSEANILNNTEAEVWAYLSLVCLKTGRQLEAEQTYKYALKLCTDQRLLDEIHQVQREVGFGNPMIH